eukprot:gene13231-biopygen16544
MKHAKTRTDSYDPVRTSAVRIRMSSCCEEDAPEKYECTLAFQMIRRPRLFIIKVGMRMCIRIPDSVGSAALVRYLSGTSSSQVQHSR